MDTTKVYANDGLPLISRFNSEDSRGMNIGTDNRNGDIWSQHYIHFARGLIVMGALDRELDMLGALIDNLFYIDTIDVIVTVDGKINDTWGDMNDERLRF